MSKTTWLVIIVILLGLAGWGITKAVQSNAPEEADYSVFYEAQNRNHIEVGAEHPPHNSNPPSGGWHYALTSHKGFFDEPIPDENVIHNLEHGDVWISYHPRISQEAKSELKKFAFSKILISPRETNDTDIALVAWERVDKFNLDGGQLPEGRIRDFIKRYRDKGPERIPAGAMENTFN